MGGGINGFCVIFERIIRDKKLYHILPDMVKWITTMGITLFSWQFFRFQNITEVWNWMKVMFGVFQFDIIPYSWQYYFDMKIVTLIVIGIFGSTLFGSEKIGDLSQKIFLSKVGFVVKELCLLILFIMSILFMVNSTYSPFIYLVLVNKYVGLISLQYYQTIIAYIIDTMPIATVSNIAQ